MKRTRWREGGPVTAGQCERPLQLPLGAAFCIKPLGHDGAHEYHFFMSEHERRRALGGARKGKR